MSSFTSILGLKFYTGDVPGLLRLTAEGGLVVVPSAPVLVDLTSSEAHRLALEEADFAITDSGFMVLLWLVLRGKRLPRISGLRYLRALVEDPLFKKPGATFWVMPSLPDQEANAAWLNAAGVSVDQSQCYVAPRYPAGPLEDEALARAIEAVKPRYIILCLGGGVQERLGHYLKRRLSHKPAILCTGAAVAFLSGRQAAIPPLADRLMLGWLLRTLSNPRLYIGRYVKALRLAGLLIRYGSRSVAGSGPKA